MVYLVFLVIVAALHSVRKSLAPLRDSGSPYSFVRFSFFFVLYHIGQCFIQILMVVMIWVRAYYEPCLSSFLWGMIILGYLVPLAANLAFFIPEYYFVEELIIRICTNNGATLNVEYTEKGCYLKWLYTYISPLLVFLSFLYFFFLCGFIALTSISYDDRYEEYSFLTYLDGPEDSFTWVIFYCVLGGFIGLINIQVVLICTFYLFILAIIGCGLFGILLVLPFVIIFSPAILVGLVVLLLTGGCCYCLVKSDD